MSDYIETRKRTGRNICSMRKQLNLTQLELSCLAKVSVSTIEQIEKGARYPRVTTAMAIARSLNTSIQSLIS